MKFRIEFDVPEAPTGLTTYTTGEEPGTSPVAERPTARGEVRDGGASAEAVTQARASAEAAPQAEASAAPPQDAGEGARDAGEAPPFHVDTFGLPTGPEGDERGGDVGAPPPQARGWR